MRPRHSTGLTALIVILGSGPARGGDSPAAMTLKDKGLAKVGHAYVIDDEAPVLAKIKEARAAFAAYSALADRQAQAEQGAANLARIEERRAELQTHLDDLNQQIIEQGTQQGGNMSRPGGVGGVGGGAAGAIGPRAGTGPMTAERDQTRAYLAELAAELKRIKAQIPPARERTGLDDNVRKSEEAFRAALATLRPLVDQVSGKYAGLAADEAVKKAMDEVKQASKAKVKLGPSDAFLAAARQLDQAERQFLGKKAPAATSKKKTRAKK